MIHVPLITPFGADGRVALPSLERLAHEVLRDGATGLVALGTTGEPATLDDDERAEVVSVVGRVCRERGARFVVGVGANGTGRAARELTALAALPVVPDAALVTVPSFVRPGEAGVLAHFRALAAAGPVPLLAYHVPHRTAQPLGAAALRGLAAIPGVRGVKYATGGIDAEVVGLLGWLQGAGSGDPGGALGGGGLGERSGGDGLGGPSGGSGGEGALGGSAALPGDGPFGPFGPFGPLGADRPAAGFEVLAGDDVFAPALLALGAHGGILASAHVATARWAELAATGDRGLGHRLAALAGALFREPNPAVIKAVLHARGRIPTPDVRLPLLPASPGVLAEALRMEGALAAGREGKARRT